MEKVIIDKERCKGCDLCVSVCPKKILRLSPDEINAKGYSPAECIDQDECIACGFCFTICPDFAITINDKK